MFFHLKVYINDKRGRGGQKQPILTATPEKLSRLHNDTIPMTKDKKNFFWICVNTSLQSESTQKFMKT